MDLVDIVNENDEVIGQVDRNNNPDFVNLKNVRGAEIFLITEDEKIVIPKRSANRRIYPNCYDYSVAGMVDSGDDYEFTAYKEMKEEVGIDNITLTEIGYLNPYKGESNIFTKIYSGYIKEKITDYDQDGIAEILYLSIDEVEKLLTTNPELFKKTFKNSFEVFKKWYQSK